MKKKKSKGFNLSPELVAKLEKLKEEHSINLSNWVEKVLSKATQEVMNDENN